jgi:type VII secretion-associated serine protease mycosin
VPRRFTLLRIAVIALFTAVGLAVPAPAQADAIRDRQWHLDYLDIAAAHKITRGEGVTVAVVDTGVDHQHLDLKGALLKGKSFAGDRDDGWGDRDGHGTAMASLIAGRGHGPSHRDGALGIAPKAKIMPVRVNRTGLADNRAIEQGIEWAADHGADIVSFAGGGPAEGNLREAVSHALEKGVVIVASAGNTASGDEQVAWPAAAPGVVAVSGTDRDGEFTNASVTGLEVVLSAPAERIMGAGSGKRGRYFAGTGTSGSTAIVAGVAALMKSKYPDLDAANVINRLIATADDRGPDGRDEQYGYGIVDPVKALTADVPKVEANPLLPQSTTSPAGPSPTAGEADAGLSPLGVTIAVLGGGAAFALAIAVLAIALRRTRRTPGA